MYIPDGICAPLCGHCLDRYSEGQRPPWQPDAIGRTAGFLCMIFASQPAPLPQQCCENIAEFLEESYSP